MYIFQSTNEPVVMGNAFLQNLMEKRSEKKKKMDEKLVFSLFSRSIFGCLNQNYFFCLRHNIENVQDLLSWFSTMQKSWGIYIVPKAYCINYVHITKLQTSHITDTTLKKCEFYGGFFKFFFYKVGIATGQIWPIWPNGPHFQNKLYGPI